MNSASEIFAAGAGAEAASSETAEAVTVGTSSVATVVAADERFRNCCLFMVTRFRGEKKLYIRRAIVWNTADSFLANNRYRIVVVLLMIFYDNHLLHARFYYMMMWL